MPRLKLAPPPAFRPENGALKSGDDVSGVFITRGRKFKPDEPIQDCEDYILTDGNTPNGHLSVVLDGHGGTACSRFGGQAILEVAHKISNINKELAGVSLSE